MHRYILDTDHVSLILGNHPQVTTTAAKYSISVSVITVQELFNGWIGRINDPAFSNDLPMLYNRLWTTTKFLQTVEILDFTQDADACLKQLLRENSSLRKNRLHRDMRIAAIALSLNATVVTRNQKDFGQVPGLTIADWSL